MAEAILVLNAGSSSLKFSVFLTADSGLELWLRGQAEALQTAPRFTAEDAAGKSIAERTWEKGEALGHEAALAHLVEFLRTHGAGHRVTAVGHRVVHGGVEFSEPIRVT